MPFLMDLASKLAALWWPALPYLMLVLLLIIALEPVARARGIRNRRGWRSRLGLHRHE